MTGGPRMDRRVGLPGRPLVSEAARLIGLRNPASRPELADRPGRSRTGCPE